MACQQLAAFPLGLLMAPHCRPLGRWPTWPGPSMPPASCSRLLNNGSRTSWKPKCSAAIEAWERRRAGAGRRDPGYGARASPRASVRLKRTPSASSAFGPPNFRAGMERPHVLGGSRGRRVAGRSRPSGQGRTHRKHFANAAGLDRWCRRVSRPCPEKAEMKKRLSHVVPHEVGQLIVHRSRP